MTKFCCVVLTYMRACAYRLRNKKIVTAEKQRPSFLDMWLMFHDSVEDVMKINQNLTRRETILLCVKTYNEGKHRNHKVTNDERDAMRNLELSPPEVAKLAKSHYNTFKHAASGM